MKSRITLNRWLGLAAIALLVVAAAGAISTRSFAQTSTPVPATQEACGPDTDNVQDGDQSEVKDANKANDTQDKQAEANCGEKDEADGTDAAPAGTPAITADQAQKIAEDYLKTGVATKSVELDNEDGQLVYSVTFGGTDVKVDALTGAVLKVETGQD